MPYLAFNLNDGNEFIFDLLEDRLSLGRNPRNEIVIDNNQISSFHAEFARQSNGAYLLTDLKSSNGTFVNSRRIESAELKPGDRVRFGQLEARFREMHLPGPGREKKGPAPSAEEKRRDADSTEGPRPRTDFIPIEKPPIEAAAPANARTVAAPNVQPIAPTCPPPGSCTTIPKPTAAPWQIVARAPAPPPKTASQKPADGPAPPTVRVPVAPPVATAPADELQEQLALLKADIAAEEASRRGRLAGLDQQLAEAARALQAAKDQAESLRAANDRLNMEASAAQAALRECVARRNSEEDRTILLAAIAAGRQQEIEETACGLDELRQQRVQGEDTLRRLRDQIVHENKRLGEAAEEELSLQVKLGALNESVASAQRRLDQALRERAHEEEDHARALEKAGRDLEEARRRASEEAKLSEIALTAKLKERVRDLEAKHDLLRRSLQASTDENTVILFANDLIKRIDLIDILIQRVTGPGINGGMEQQLRTLRASFEDILEAHGIAEFKVAPGTEVDVDLRRHIAIVESISGPARPKVVESFRPGFIYSTGRGGEVVLRKVEVKTSSE